MSKSNKSKRTKSPMKTGLSSRKLPAPNVETFNFLDAKEEPDVERGLAGQELPAVKAGKRAKGKL